MHLPNTMVKTSGRQVTAEEGNIFSVSHAITFLALELWKIEVC
jgi:hypothetical protein